MATSKFAPEDVLVLSLAPTPPPGTANNHLGHGHRLTWQLTHRAYSYKAGPSTLQCNWRTGNESMLIRAEQTRCYMIHAPEAESMNNANTIAKHSYFLYLTTGVDF